MASDILADLDISRDLLDIFEQCDIGLYELLTLSLQDLKEYLEQTGVNWSYENLFERITSWRKRNKTQIAQLLLSGSSLQEPPEAAASSSLPKADEHFEIVTEIILHPESQPEEEQESQPEEEQGESQQEEKEELREKSTDVENSQPEPLAEERVQSPSDQLDTSQSEKTNTVAEDVNKHSSPSVQSYPDQQSRPDTSRLITLNPEWLNGLLLSSEKGKDILRRSEHGELSEPKQQQLAEIVANYHISLHRNLRSEDLENYSLAITTLFKSEKKVRINI
ncbi:glutamic acid-rich protein-like [Aedes albopictus]|uniref:Death domain-containing protein n=1 Tax=Aedes albopictus TaxID=7160 RepID=A0ABM1ZTM9_AEDAL